jgi:hypothetical protein
LHRLVPFLASTSVLAIWIDTHECSEQRKLRVILWRLGFRVEAGTRCEDGLAVSARRMDSNQQLVAA